MTSCHSNVSDSPPSRRARIIQSYSTGGANAYLHLIHGWSLGPRELTPSPNGISIGPISSHGVYIQSEQHMMSKMFCNTCRLRNDASSFDSDPSLLHRLRPPIEPVIRDKTSRLLRRRDTTPISSIAASRCKSSTNPSPVTKAVSGTAT